MGPAASPKRRCGHRRLSTGARAGKFSAGCAMAPKPSRARAWKPEHRVPARVCFLDGADASECASASEARGAGRDLMGAITFPGFLHCTLPPIFRHSIVNRPIGRRLFQRQGGIGAYILSNIRLYERFLCLGARFQELSMSLLSLLCNPSQIQRADLRQIFIQHAAPLQRSMLLCHTSRAYDYVMHNVQSWHHGGMHPSVLESFA